MLELKVKWFEIKEWLTTPTKSTKGLDLLTIIVIGLTVLNTLVRM